MLEFINSSKNYAKSASWQTGHNAAHLHNNRNQRDNNYNSIFIFSSWSYKYSRFHCRLAPLVPLTTVLINNC